MEYVNAVLIVIGFIIIGYYQKQKIGALENQINSQKDLIGSTKAFFDLFDLGKLKGYVEIVEKKVKTEMECQMTELKNDFGKKQDKSLNAIRILLEELDSVVDVFGKSLVYLSRDRRETIIEGMKEGIAKRAFTQVSKQIDEIVIEARQAAIKTLLETAPPIRKKSL